MHRVFVEKQAEFNTQARELLHDLRDNLNIHHLKHIRVVQRYDVGGLSEEEFAEASRLILSEPQVDNASAQLDLADDEIAFAVEYLPGQYDQRADSAAQCVQILTQGSKPLIGSAHVIILGGNLSKDELAQVKAYTINAVDSREASMNMPKTLEIPSDIPEDVEILEYFINASADDLCSMRDELGLAMSAQDLIFTQTYFRDEEGRNPSITEIKMLDTYWSDHCRHSTFATKIEKVEFEQQDIVAETYAKYQASRDTVYGCETDRPETLMDIALIAMKELRKTGELDNVEVSEEINAASIVVPVDVDGVDEDWLVMFKNETHNHPTEIEPFGGAATCLGGCIRDPLSGRSYVYQAMRVTGAADPRTPFSETLPGKLPQRKICREAAHGYSSYGNQIGLATGQVSEVYHPNYVAKRMEIGAVVAAAPKENVFRGSPATGDVILLIGGRTGRDGVGGATGSSKEHTDTALDNSAEVQKGNPPTERKIQRLFRNPELARKIKVCNDFGAGGVSVAIGEIAPSLDINLDEVPKKYDGLDGTELAISESQERMAICVDPSTIAYFKAECDKENLECNHVADVTDTGRLTISWRGKNIVNFSRAFLDTNGVTLSTNIEVKAPSADSPLGKPIPALRDSAQLTHAERMQIALSDLNTASQKGLGEMFDGSIGSGSVLNPFGGKHQLTPTDAMVAKIPLLKGNTTTCTHMSWGFNPNIANWSPFHGALYAVTESVCRIVASGAQLSDIRLTLQEYFEKLGNDPARWGKPFAALLGAFLAQNELRLGAIGGKDSMSGSFNDIDVPPTLVSFAVAPGKTQHALSPEFKQADSNISLVTVPRDDQGVPAFKRLQEIAALLYSENKTGKILAIHSLAEGGIAAGIAKMSFGNHIGADLDTTLNLYQERYFSFIVESTQPLDQLLEATKIGLTTNTSEIQIDSESIEISSLLGSWSSPLESTYPTQVQAAHQEVRSFSYTSQDTAPRNSTGNRSSKPKVIIPTFPGTNCEYDTAKAFNHAGADANTLIFRNLSPTHVEESLRELAEHINQSQILMLPGGFSAGDEPDGSGKFIATVLRNPRISDAVMDLISNRDGLILGICNGFQALIKTGLVPYGKIQEPTQSELGSPTLTFNDIGRHIARYATTRIASTKSPWLSNCQVGDLHNIAFSHGEGKFYASNEEINQLAKNGQIATQYTDLDGNPSMDVDWNPNGSLYAIEAITSPCGRILGKMGHTERRGQDVAKNIPGNKHQPLFKAGVDYFS
ncbi:MAG: phosphoribosylformylglycinamidine synthase [Akkermansiaceae bacterium]|nr:phosphoribosylformylglycinamidine synthase [Akkermansiaceae bacterium]